MMALARRIVSRDEDEDETVETVFAQARNAEATAEELLVDDGWKPVEPELDAIPVSGNGHSANGNGFDIIGPTVEMAPVDPHVPTNGNGNSHTPTEVPANGNGYHADGEADEPQQSLFSWTEFMVQEPAKPKRRNGKSQSATRSMFEWAMEQEREKETVGAGR